MVSYPRSSECGERFNCSFILLCINFGHFLLCLDEGSFFVQLLAGVRVDGMVLGCLGGAHGQGGLQGHVSLQVEFLHSCPSQYIQDWEITSGQAARLTGGRDSGSGKHKILRFWQC